MLSDPSLVKSWPFRALRVGSTQSNMSMPRATHSTRSSGVPTPIRYRGLIVGQQRRRDLDCPYISSGVFADAESADRVALESDAHRQLGAPRAQLRRSAALDDAELRLPGLVMGTSGDASVAEREQPARQRAAQRAVSSTDARKASRVAGNAGHSSSTMAMSDPSCAWMSTAFSGVSS